MKPSHSYFQAMGSAARTLDWRKLPALSTGSGAGANVAFAVLCMVVCLVTGEVSGERPAAPGGHASVRRQDACKPSSWTRRDAR